MTKPDFREEAGRALDQWDINRTRSAVEYALRAAYSAGLDRAAEIADAEVSAMEPNDYNAACREIAAAIRAEKETTNDHH